MKGLDRRQIAGWFAVGLSTAVTCFWAFWGIVENFHEGWYYESLPSNLGLMFVQYLSPMLLFLGVTLLSIFWPRVGAGLHGILALLVVWFFGAFSNPITLVLMVPLLGLGALYWYGRPGPRRARPRKVAACLAIGLPLLTLLLAGAGPALRVFRRVDDGYTQARRVQGNGVALVWAPQGPGWPSTGTDWHEALQVCEHLRGDGLTLAPVPQDVWRLPAVDEAVHSMARHGVNSGGLWDEETSSATYDTRPDKESPLWDLHSQVIYWWTATEADGEHAYIIVYDGKVWPRAKGFGPDYLGYRCVKQP